MLSKLASPLLRRQSDKQDLLNFLRSL